MDQTSTKTSNKVSVHEGFRLLESGKRIAFIQADWHRKIVSQARESFISECEKLGVSESRICQVHSAAVKQLKNAIEAQV